MTEWIVGPGEPGREAELVELAAAHDLLIVTVDSYRAERLHKAAHESGRKIRKPVPLGTWLRNPALFNDYKLGRPGIIVDDAGSALSCLLHAPVVFAAAEGGELAKPVRCRDCRFVYIEDGAIKRHWCDRKERGKQHSFVCHPQGFCAWGEPRENPCRNADESAAAFADAPTLETAREPKQAPVFELGA